MLISTVMFGDIYVYNINFLENAHKVLCSFFSPWEGKIVGREWEKKNISRDTHKY